MSNCYLKNKDIDKDEWIDYCDEKWEKMLKDLGNDGTDLEKLSNFK